MPEQNSSLIRFMAANFIDETERPKNKVMRAIERLSKAYIWVNF